MAWNPRLRAVAEAYAPRGVRFLAINGNDSLKADLRQLAKAEDIFDSSPFFGDAKVDVEISEDESGALLSWR